MLRFKYPFLFDQVHLLRPPPLLGSRVATVYTLFAEDRPVTARPRKKYYYTAPKAYARTGHPPGISLLIFQTTMTLTLCKSSKILQKLPKKAVPVSL
jgi:hypothetical protein